jgi:type VI secretion system lysozyme-like protein
LAVTRDLTGIPGPRRISGLRALLFERLVDERHPDPQDPAAPPDRLLDRAALRASIGIELDRLFNTRAPVDAETLDQRRRSTIDYGIPDLSLYSAQDPQALEKLAKHLTAAVEIYEPRLHKAKVKVVPDPKRAGKLIAEIAGSLTLGDEVESVSFRLMLGGEADDGE